MRNLNWRFIMTGLFSAAFFALACFSCEMAPPEDYRTISLLNIDRAAAPDGNGGAPIDWDQDQDGDQNQGAGYSYIENKIKDAVEGTIKDALRDDREKLDNGETVSRDLNLEGADYTIKLAQDQDGDEIYDVAIKGLDLTNENALKGFIKGIQEGLSEKDEDGDIIWSSAKDIRLDLTECTGAFLQPILGKPAIDKDQYISIKLPDTVKTLISFATIDKSSGETIIVPAFTGFDYLESVILPGVLKIGDEDFKDMSNLETVVAPKVETIGKKAFNNCRSLTDLGFTPELIRSIGEDAFYNCSSLEEVNFLAITSIPDRAFRGCEVLETLNFTPELITSIGKGAFEFCERLTEVNFPAITEIKDETFQGCTNLSTVILTNDDIRGAIGASAFNGCKITEAIFPNVEMIESNAFKNCTDLETTNFSNVKYIRSSAFENCVELQSVSFPAVAEDYHDTHNENDNYVPAIGDAAFKGCTTLNSVDIPNVEKIAQNAFEGCTNLTAVDFPEVTHVGVGCFSGCIALAEVKLPALEEFKERTFENTEDQALAIYLKATAPTFANTEDASWTTFTFNGVSATKNVTIYTPALESLVGYDTDWENKFKGDTNTETNSNITLTYSTYTP